MKKRPSVGIVVILKNKNKLLLGKRLVKHGFGEWGLIGGRLELGESFKECAIRETKEETGIKLSRPKPVQITNVIYSKDNHSVALFYLAETNKEPKNPEPNKLEEWKWFEWNKLPTPLFLPVKKLKKSGLLKKIFSNKKLSDSQINVY